MKWYCNVCDKVQDFFHGREHFNWEEFATPEEIARAEERHMGWINLIKERSKLKNAI